MTVEEAVRRMGLAQTYKDPHWRRAVKVTDDVVQKAEPGWLEALLFALLQVEAPTFPMRYGFEVALRRLATAPGDAARVANVRVIAAEGRSWGDVRCEPAEVAEWLASGQPVEHLLGVFATADASDELAACLLQETVLRHDAPAAAGFADRLRAAGHPLADLPLRRRPSERDHGLPWYPGLPEPRWSQPGDGAPLAPGPAGLDVTATELDWPDAHRVLSAHRTWIPDGGETTETRLFQLDRPLARDDFGGSLLRVLGAASTGGTLTGPHRVTTADVLRKLFGAATAGSVYGRRMYGAYGRRASWESLAALAGVEETDFATIESAADRCTWLFYTSDWHIQVIPPMDTGIAVLRPDGRTVAVLAATDAD